MPSLRSLYLKYLLDQRSIAVRRTLFELWRTLRFRKRIVSVFLQIDDPYSYLLSYYLSFLLPRYGENVNFRYYLCQSLGGDYMPRPAMLAEYAMSDCKLLAREFGVPFLDVGDTPAVEFRRTLMDFLASEQNEEDFAETFTAALRTYWRGDVEGVSRLMGRDRGDSNETNVLIGKNQLRLRKMGHYCCATVHYAGDWYWGVDRLLYLVDRLDRQRLNRFQEVVPEIASLTQAVKLELPATIPSSAATLPVLDMFHSFRSPYSYLALKSTFAVADAFGLKLEVKPILPLVNRGFKVPQNKLRYIVTDANRTASKRGLPFGNIADPLGVGVERCIAAFYYAKNQGRERDFLLEVGKAVYASSVDVSTDEGMKAVAQQSGLFWPELQAAMKDDTWRDAVKANSEELAEIGHWGVPVLKLGDQSFWGQDRDWLLARHIEDQCAGGEGILI